MFLLLIVLLLFTNTLAQKRGELCTLRSTGKKGLCLREIHCNNAQKLGNPRHKILPFESEYCESDRTVPVVCCPLSTSEIKCLTYYKPRTKTLFIASGIKTTLKEFPHMAAVGYGDESNIRWLCGGSLISENFVLTAAHCLTSREAGPARWVRLGDLNLDDPNDDAEPQNFTITQTFVPSDYKKSSHYHDIALLKLNQPVEFNSYVKPICLHIKKTDVPDSLVVTGWGKTSLLGDSSSHLLKATLNKIDVETCKKSFSSVSKQKLSEGIVDRTQICAGGSEGKDTCPGDSGGPLQYLVKQNPDIFRLVGITSFGKGCGFQNSVGVYTRVSNYVRWIEEIVWNE